jgi:hypothetical protein
LITSGHIVCVLRNTLRRLEQSGALERNDPALIHLKRRLVLAIAEIEWKKDLKHCAELEEPIFVLRIRNSIQPRQITERELCSRD